MTTRTLGMLEASALCDVDRRTMLRWIKGGLLRAQSTAGGQHRIAVDDLVGLMRSRGIPVPAELDASPPIVLLVEDDALVARVMVAIVNVLAPHMVVRHAKDGFEAGWMIMEARPRVVLLDLGLPGLHGVEVIRRVRSAPEVVGTQFIVVSGEISEVVHEELCDLGVVAIITKPVAIDALRDAFARVGVLGSEPTTKARSRPPPRGVTRAGVP